MFQPVTKWTKQVRSCMSCSSDGKLQSAEDAVVAAAAVACSDACAGRLPKAAGYGYKQDARSQVQLVHGGLVSSYVREAMRRANEERPGTAHLELPEDVAGELVRPAREHSCCAVVDEGGALQNGHRKRREL